MRGSDRSFSRGNEIAANGNNHSSPQERISTDSSTPITAEAGRTYFVKTQASRPGLFQNAIRSGFSQNGRRVGYRSFGRGKEMAPDGNNHCWLSSPTPPLTRQLPRANPDLEPRLFRPD